MPFDAFSSLPTAIAGLQLEPLNAFVISPCTWFALGGAPGFRFTQAPLLTPTLELVLLEMKVMVAPQPAEVAPPKKHELRAIGNRHAAGGGVAGGLATATDSAKADML